MLNWVICMIGLCFVSACAFRGEGNYRISEYEREKFFLSSWPEVKTHLTQQPIQDQYRLYLYAVQVIHPPLLRYADPIAHRGEAAVPFLLEQLKQTNNESTVSDIVYLFKRMADLNIYYADDNQALWLYLVSRAKPYVVTDGWPPIALTLLVDIQEANPSRANRRLGRRLYDDLCSSLEISGNARASVCRSRRSN